MKSAVRIFRDTYVDSVVQLSATRAMHEVEGVDWAAAAMATPANLRRCGRRASPTRIWRMPAPTTCSSPSGQGDDGRRRGGVGRRGGRDVRRRGDRRWTPSSSRPAPLGQALARQPRQQRRRRLRPRRLRGAGGAQGAVRRARCAAVQRQRAGGGRGGAEGAGRAARPPGHGPRAPAPRCSAAPASASPTSSARPVGVVGRRRNRRAGGHDLLDRWGAGVSAVIGLGGRDLSEAVGGRMAKAGDPRAARRPGTEVILLVSKPPAERVAARRAGRPPAATRWSPRSSAWTPRRRTSAARAAGRTLGGGRASRRLRAARAGCRPDARRGPGAAGGRGGRRGWPPNARWSAACSPAGRCATSLWSSSAAARPGVLQRPAAAPAAGCRRPPAATSASISARRSTPGAGPTR